MPNLLIDSLQSLETDFSSQSFWIRFVSSIVIIIVLWLLRALVLRLIFRRVEDVSVRYWWKKILTYVAVGLGIFFLGIIWISKFDSIATLLALVLAGMAIALQSPITDMAGWVFILWQRPFEVGDRIQIGQYKGDVIDVRLFQYSLLEIGNWVDADQNTGRIMHLPNKTIFSEVLANYSQGFEYVWNEIPVLVTFESDWEKAKVVLQEIAQQRTPKVTDAVREQFKDAARRYMITHIKLDPIVYIDVEASGVLLTIRYICAYNNRRASAHIIWEDILRAFANDPDLEFAYPTQRLYNDWVERLDKS